MNFKRKLLALLLAACTVFIGAKCNSLAPARWADEQVARVSPERPLSTNPYTKALDETLLDLRQQMLTKSIKFDDHFRNLLKSSKINLHMMFSATYGSMYESNTEIFTNMFESLEQYYAHGQVKLTKAMQSFFEKLYQKVFQMLFMYQVLTPSYLECATEQLTLIKPFKDVPDKLIREIRHVFMAARTFVQEMNHGIDVIKDIMSLGQPAHCINLINDKLLKNTLVASSIQQTTSATRLPCVGFCEQVISKCIGSANLGRLSESWKGYVLGLNELAQKLSTSYDIETIIAPLDVQISEAIMNFHDDSKNISQAVASVCGPINSQPVDNFHGSAKQRTNPRFTKRSASSAPATASIVKSAIRQVDHQFGSLNVHQPLGSLTLGGQLRTNTRNGLAHSTLQSSEDLPKISQKSPLLIDEIRTYMMSTKSFWSSLPHTVCTSNLTLGSGADKRQTNCFHEPFSRSDVNSDLRQHFEINQQVSRLDDMRARINSALKGEENDWNNEPGQGPALVNPGMVAFPGGRFNFSPTTSTTTTTTTPEPSEDQIDDDDPMEPGSGEESECNPDTTNCDSDSGDPEDEVPESSEPDSYPDEDSTGADHPTTTPLPKEKFEGPGIQDSDQPPQATPEADPSNAITPPEQPGARRSGQTSSKLVIDYSNRTLLAVLMFVALFILTNLNQNQLIFAQSYSTVNQH